MFAETLRGLKAGNRRTAIAFRFATNVYIRKIRKNAYAYTDSRLGLCAKSTADSSLTFQDSQRTSFR